MANITQTIPALTAGISQQPDEQKIPGQVKDMVNAIPDVTQGLLKRPSGKFVASLSDGSNNAVTNGKWFHYYRDENEQYIGQVRQGGQIKMWACSEVKDSAGNTIHNAGAEVNVVDASSTQNEQYLAHTNDEDIQTLTLNDFTYINNRTKTVAMDTTTEPDTNFKKEMYVELKSISYAKQYALNLFSDTTSTAVTTATRIKVEKTDTDETDTCPHVATEIFDIQEIYHNSAKNKLIHPTSLSVRTSQLNSTTYRQYTERNRFVLNNGMKYNDDNSSGGGEETHFLSRSNYGGSTNSARWKLEGQITNADGTVNNISFVTGAFVGYGSYGGADYSAWADGAWRGSGPLVDSFKNDTGRHSNFSSYSSQLFTIEECGVTATGANNPGALIVILKDIDDSLTGTWTLRRCNPDGSLRSDQTEPEDYETGVAIPFDGTETNNWSGKGVGIDYVKDNNRKDLYFRLATTGQSVPTGASNSITYKCRYTTTYDLLFGGSGWASGDTFNISMKTGSIYSVTIEKISTSQVQANLAKARPQPTPFDTKTTITAQSILGDLRSAIIADGNISSSNIEIIGSGLYIKHTVKFNGSTPVGELLNVVAGRVNDVGELPTQCKNGMVVEVVNSAAEEDNYYVKFFGNNDKDGEGIWEECAKPGRKIRFDKSTMPLVLIRTADGNFRLSQLDGSTYDIGGVTQPNVPQWDDCLVGDELTNPEPSFVGKTINKLLFFRNRFAILADENIVLSRPGDFTNFWAKSAIQLIASDPIDISASSEYPAILFDGIQVNTGLVLFSKNQQFMLTTDSDAFSPLTAKINALSTYNFNPATNPISLGTTLGFLDNAGKHSRFFEMARVQREGEPEIIEQSAVVSKLFEKDLKLISNSRENSVIFFSSENTSTLYGYRYFDQINERKLASWFKWQLTGDIIFHCMLDDSLFVVVKNGTNKYQLLKYAIKADSDTFMLAENRVHLDHLMETSGWTYNATTKKSTLTKPNGLESSNQLVAYDNTGTTNLGRYGKITVNGDDLELDGNWSGESFLIGYQFTMEVKLPTIYYLTQSGQNWRADTRAHTILHRVKFGFGPIGLYETTLSRTGRVDYTELFEVTNADQYISNTGPTVEDNNLRTVPIYDRNINTALSIKSTHPAPATIHNMTWEGVYTSNNYQRV